MKKIEKIKRISAILLIFLLNINSFATSVGDNDGSKFITKAEFDALKSNFQVQIDTYNQGIDSKIDAAIAAYLSGISIAKEADLPSIAYKAQNVKPLIFCGEYKTPLTRIGTHCKIGAHILFEKDSGVVLLDGTTEPNVGTMVYGKSGTKRQALSSADYKWKMGTGGASGSFDALKIREFDTGIDKKNIVYRLNTIPGTTNKYYTMPSDCYDCTPQTILTSYAVGGGWSTAVIKEGATAPITNMSFDGTAWTDYGGKPFGFSTSYMHWKLEGLCKADYSINIIYLDQPKTYEENTNTLNVTSCDDESFTTTDGEYISYIAGKKIPDTSILKVVKAENWNYCADTPIYSFNEWYLAEQYYWNDTPNAYTGTLPLYNDTRNNVNLEAERNLPPIKAWMRKYEDVKVNTLYHYDWSSITGEDVTYYTGIPLVTANADQNIEVELHFTNSSASANGTFAIRNEPFANQDLQFSNVDLLNLDNDSPYLDTSISLGTATQIKKFRIKAKGGETYWIKIKPASTNIIKLESKETFHAKSRD